MEAEAAKREAQAVYDAALKEWAEKDKAAVVAREEYDLAKEKVDQNKHASKDKRNSLKDDKKNAREALDAANKDLKSAEDTLSDANGDLAKLWALIESLQAQSTNAYTERVNAQYNFNQFK